LRPPVFRPRGGPRRSGRAVMDLDLDATTSDERAQRYWRLIEIGIALAAERDHNRLMEQILLGAKALTNADGGTLYLVSRDGGELRFMIMRNDSMKIALGGTTGSAIPLPPVPLLRWAVKPSTSPMPMISRNTISAACAPSTRAPATGRNRS
jgi:hypothetical protein